MDESPKRIKTCCKADCKVDCKQDNKGRANKRCGVNQHSIPAHQSKQRSEQVVKEVIHDSYLQILFRISLYPLYRIKLHLSSPIFKFNKKIFIPDFPFVFIINILIVIFYYKKLGDANSRSHPLLLYSTIPVIRMISNPLLVSSVSSSRRAISSFRASLLF